MNAYKSELWRRDLIGVQEIDADMFLKILNDCRAKTSERYARMIYRHCSSKGNDLCSFAVLNEFFDEAKRLTGSLKEIRNKVLDNWNKDIWEGFVLRSDPSQKEKYLKAFDARLKAPPKKKGFADGLDYEEYSKQPEKAKVVVKKQEAADDVLKEAQSYVAKLQAFVNDEPKKEPSRVPQQPKIPTTKSVKSNGGGIIIKSANSKRKASNNRSSSSRRPQARRRAAAGKQRS